MDGQIGYHKLTDWWLSTFTPEEREYIEQVYKPFGVGGSTDRPLTQGKISSGGNTTANLLWGLASWFKRKAGDRYIARRILAKAEQVAKTENDLMSLHFIYSQLGEVFYLDRDTDPAALDLAIDAFTQQISIASQVAQLMKQEYPKSAMPGHAGFRQMAIIWEKQKDHAKAIQLCQVALKLGWDGDWQKRIDRCLKKMKQ